MFPGGNRPLHGIRRFEFFHAGFAPDVKSLTGFHHFKDTLTAFFAELTPCCAADGQQIEFRRLGIEGIVESFFGLGRIELFGVVPHAPCAAQREHGGFDAVTADELRHFSCPVELCSGKPDHRSALEVAADPDFGAGLPGGIDEVQIEIFLFRFGNSDHIAGNGRDFESVFAAEPGFAQGMAAVEKLHFNAASVPVGNEGDGSLTDPA